MTVGQLRNSLTQEEFFHWAAYYELKSEREKEEMDKARRKG
tara:strand:+ start:1492 stop:1614 length:123 start_codon:yes stop_codon:yes gene_type:complete